MKSILLKDINMDTCFKGICGQYKNQKLDIKQVGRRSYRVRVGPHAARVSGIDGVKNFIKMALKESFIK